MVYFRKSKSLGGLFRVTATRRGLSASAGIGPVRTSVNTRKEVRGTARIPGTGVYAVKRLDGGSAMKSNTPASPDEAEFDYVDAITGEHSDRFSKTGSKFITVLDVVEQPDLTAVAQWTGVNMSGYFRETRKCLLVPQGKHYRVLLLTGPDDNPNLFKTFFGKPKTDRTPKAQDVGRLSMDSFRLVADKFDSRTIMAMAFIERGSTSPVYMDVRILTSFLETEQES